ncbi:GIY-YIG nuclease family protein [Uliginosibacterium sp. 31-16]|uniref:GIY-YIG nuclease family protein n=1 Tax=Uliginosibacterium sp. 31-16 TaxID=3068315 RepID=UPI00353218BA
MQYVYGIFVNDPEPTCLYIGTTTDPERRFKQHMRGVRDTSTTKDLYFYCRQRGYTTQLYCEVLEQAGDDEVAERWEDYWLTEFIAIGHPVQNRKRGNRTTTAKRHDPIAQLFRQVNDQNFNLPA